MATYAFLVILCVILGNHAVNCVEFGGNCTDSAACNDTLKCDDNHCACDDGYYRVTNSDLTCTKKIKIGDTCGSNDTCYDDAQCVIDGNGVSGVCKCPSDSYKLNDTACTPKIKIGDSCGSNDICYDDAQCVIDGNGVSGVCKCPSDSYKLNETACTPKIKIGDSCGSNDVCYDDAQCVIDGNGVSGVCKCPSDSYKLNDTACTPKINHGEECAGVTNECGANGTSCRKETGMTKTCLCGAQEFWSTDSNSCQDKNNLTVSNLKWTSTVNSVNLSWTQPLQTLNLSLTYIVSGGDSPTPTGVLVSPDTPTPTGVLVGNLIAGTAYNFSVQTVLAADEYYDNRTTDAAQVQNVWTKPAKPVGNGKEVKVDEKVYNFTFVGSSGGVKEYLVTIEGVLDSNKTTTTWISDVPLTPAQVYKYTIVAVNGIDEKSDSFTGSLLVGAEKPGTVSALLDISQTDTSVTLQWSIPTEPNGNLTGYLVTYYMSIPNQKCLEINISCSDCQDLWPTSVQGSGCSKSVSEDYELSQEKLNSNQSISLNIERLQPYRSYRITVQAVNKAGFGEGESIFIRTDIGVAEEIQDLSLQKTGDNKTAGLHISWTAGAETGPTNYTVKVKRKATIKSENYEFVSNYIVEGYNNTNFDINNLTAFWDYKVSVTAVTRKGSGESKTEEVKTRPNIPGTVTNFRVELDPDDAQKFTLSFNCPDETQRNGRLKEYVVQKKHENKTEEDTINHSDTCSFSIGNFKSNLKVGQSGQSYTFRVKVINDNYTGNFNHGQTHMILPKAPKFGNAQLINGPPEKQLTENYVSLELNMSRILDPSQGEIKDVGLLVCINREGKKPCGDLPDSLGKAKTYSESKQKDFQDPYLTTPLDWQKGLTEEAKYSFNVGDDQTCSQGYCNGPLPDGVSVEITVIACTEAGCSKSIATTYQTKAPSDDDAPVGAIVGGIIAVIIIVLIILGALFLWRRRRIPRAKSRNPAIAEPEPFIRKERPVNVRNFSNEIARYHKDSNMLFQDDFDDIKKLSGDLKSSSDEAKREENRVKNRYVNILPYDQSRVKLSIHPDEPETMDFINANYIPGFNSVREYIATQGPMYCTIPDFWRMMWEQNSRIIVMLSDLQEAGKRKVDLYWPENLNEPINYGNIVVEMTNFSQLRKYTIRNFIMSLGDNEPRKVTHFFLAGWMDFSANLKYSDVLEFAKLVRQEATPANSGPITVHCSAGVGRTGTFIALDYFMQHLDRHGLDGEIDIFSYVMRMRYNRPSMVQAETQYIFIYDALEEVIKEKLEKEKEKQYDNFRPNSDTYVNLNAQPQEENIYANTNGQTQPDNMHVYDNQAYAPDEMEDSKPLEETKTPTTVL